MRRATTSLTAAVLAVLCALMGADGARAAPPVDLLSDADLELDGAAAGEFAGSAVAGAGDVNGDGIADVIVGAPRAGDNGESSGAAYVVFGGQSLATVDLANLGGRGFRIDGAVASDFAGYSVGGAGDVNGDGLADVIVGAPSADNNGRAFSGSAYVVFGRAWTATVDLGSLGAGGFRIDGAALADEAGVAVAGAGDVNADGLADVIVGADGVGDDAGAAYVVFGREATTTVDLLRLDGAGFRIAGSQQGDGLGGSVAGAGDVNGDGRPDVIVGADYWSHAASGSAYVVFGTGAAADVDLHNLGAGGFRIDGAAVYDGPGVTVAGAGDVNGDGLRDVIVGAHAASNRGRPASGSAYVVFGKSSSATVDLSDLGAGGFRIDGAVSGEDAGVAVGGGRDLNGDGRPDVIVGAPGASNNGRAYSGSAYVVFGKASTESVDLAALGRGGFRIDGAAAGDQAGQAVAASADVTGDGRADALVGAPPANRAGRARSGAVYGVSGWTTVTGVAASPTARGVRIRYRLSAPATVRITIRRAVRGRFVRARVLERASKRAGAKRVRVALRPGRYRATIVATRPRSIARARGFRIVHPSEET